METVVSIPEEVFQQAEEMAANLGLSRSELYAMALTKFINQQQPDLVTERLDEIYADAGSDLDAVIERLQAISLLEERW
jgi:antitoxin component of RelBE/YafQ-DinJ toxin-antitoxin module